MIDLHMYDITSVIQGRATKSADLTNISAVLTYMLFMIQFSLNKVHQYQLNIKILKKVLNRFSNKEKHITNKL